MKRIFGLAVLMMLCIYLVFSNATISQNHSDKEYMETNTRIQNNSEAVRQILPELEYLHQEYLDKEVDGYIIETYREFEIYKDQDGKVLKQVPTSNYNILKYKKY